LIKKKDNVPPQKKPPKNKELDIKESEDKKKDWDLDFIP